MGPQRATGHRMMSGRKCPMGHVNGASDEQRASLAGRILGSHCVPPPLTSPRAELQAGPRPRPRSAAGPLPSGLPPGLPGEEGPQPSSCLLEATQLFVALCAASGGGQCVINPCSEGRPSCDSHPCLPSYPPQPFGPNNDACFLPSFVPSPPPLLPFPSSSLWEGN